MEARSGRSFELSAGDSAQFEKAQESFLRSSYSTGRAGVMPTTIGPTAASFGDDFAFLVQVVRLNSLSDNKREALRTNRSATFLRPSRRGATCWSYCNRRRRQQIQRHLSSSRSASWRSCVAPQMVSKRTELFVVIPAPSAIDNRLPNPSLHLLRLAAQHRRLIGDTTVFKCMSGIEAGRMALRIFPETPAYCRRAGCNRKRNRFQRA